MFNGHPVTFFPYTGWHSGKSIRDGRGIGNLIRQINISSNTQVNKDIPQQPKQEPLSPDELIPELPFLAAMISFKGCTMI